MRYSSVNCIEAILGVWHIIPNPAQTTMDQLARVLGGILT